VRLPLLAGCPRWDWKLSASGLPRSWGMFFSNSQSPCSTSSLDRTLLVSNHIFLLLKQALMAAANGQPGTAEAVLSVWAMASGAAGSAASDRQQLPMFGTPDGLEGAIKRLLAVMQVWQCRQQPNLLSVDM
jgi:hypothetical protein